MTAASPALAGDLTAFARARADDGDGRVDQAVAGYAEALMAAPGNLTVARRAYREALEAGDDALALRAIATLMPSGAAPFDAALFLYADAVHRGDSAAQAEAMKRIDEGPFDFLLPSLRAWQVFANRGDPLRTARCDHGEPDCKTLCRRNPRLAADCHRQAARRHARGAIDAG